MSITGQEVIGRIQKKFGSGWMDTKVDTIMAGSGDVEVKGIVTTYAPSLEVLHKAVGSGKNMIISRESPYWGRTNGPGGGTQFSGLPSNWPNGPDFSRQEAGAPTNDPTYMAKSQYIAANNLIVYRLFANWNAQPEDMQLKGLATALGWEKHYKPSGGKPWAKNNGFFELKPASLKETAQTIKKTLKLKSIRVAGNPDTVVHKAALSHGMYWLPDVQKMYAEPGVDLVVMGEPFWENELSLYSFDISDMGQKKGYILLGQEASEEPGCGEMATWLKSFVTEVPVEHISTGEPSWMPY
jgi:putative NIF3 family GTP cyclohydrolase 1 type 2